MNGDINSDDAHRSIDQELKRPDIGVAMKEILGRCWK